ncbi:MAG: ASCH domain-containing protein [Methanomicrobia archaeon]|nr:ASCH domain-containing protein [Methanomicrobia archaeon]
MMNEHISVKKMWIDFLSTIGENEETTEKKYSSWYFSNNEKDANDLAELVRRGIKKATTTSLWRLEHDKEPVPQVGEYSVITDWNGVAMCIIQTTKVDIMPFNQVSSDFAATEGEGDKSLTYWRKVHKKFFAEELKSRGMKFSDEMPVVCEEFNVVFQYY